MKHAPFGTLRRPCPFAVGDRVVLKSRMPRRPARVGTVVAVRDEWPTIGNEAHQAVEVRYDRNDAPLDAIGYESNWGAIRPWSAFKAAS